MQIPSSEESSLMCRLHGKLRFRNRLKEVEVGVYECLVVDRCRTRKGLELPSTPPPPVPAAPGVPNYSSWLGIPLTAAEEAFCYDQYLRTLTLNLAGPVE